jgi:hypothetical protein
MQWTGLLWEAINLAKQDALDKQLFKQEFLFFL